MSEEITKVPTAKVDVICAPGGKPAGDRMDRVLEAARQWPLLVVAAGHLKGLVEKHTGRVALQLAEKDLELKDAERRVKEATALKFEAEAQVAQQQHADWWVGMLEGIQGAVYLDDIAKGRLIQDLLLNNPKAPLAVRRLLQILAFGASSDPPACHTTPISAIQPRKEPGEH